MKKNLKTSGRTVRIVVGLVVLSLAFWGPKSPWAYLGILPILAGLVGWCALYPILGISRSKGKQE